jgi:Taurine catabolism dioxygenase TauD, TfdA family
MNNKKTILNTLPHSSAELKKHLSLSGVGFWRGAVHTLYELEQLTQSWFGRFHQPATRVDSRDQSVDGYTSRVGTEGYLLGHAEGYYRPHFPPPDVCVFWCQQAPTVQGGETTLLDGAELYRKLPSALASRLENEGVVYEAIWTMTRWQAEFGVPDATSLKTLLEATPSCQYTLNAKGELHFFHHVQPILRSSDGIPKFINGLLSHLPNITHPRYAGRTYCRSTNRMHWGHGGELQPATINTLIDAHDAVLNKHRWQDFDLLVLDNHRLLHGREPMVGDSVRTIFSRFGYWL